MIARELERQIGAMHLRIDSIEQAIRNCFPVAPPLDDAGYRVAYAIAEDNLHIGRTVVADSVNPLPITRETWLEVGQRTQIINIEIEVICSDPREYHSWNREHIVTDTASRSVEQNVKIVRQALPAQ